MKKGSKHSAESRAKMATRKGQVPWNKGLKTGIAPSNKGCFGPYSVSGVYQIECAGELYVGSSKNVRIRWNSHKLHLRIGKHDNSRMQALCALHGWRAFKITLLERVPEGQLIEAEQRWLDKLKPSLNLVQIAGNTGRPASTWTPEQRAAASRRATLNNPRRRVG